MKKESYQRSAKEVLLKCTKQEAKTMMIARFGLLDSGKNFKGSRSEMCDTCNQTKTKTIGSTTVKNIRQSTLLIAI